MAALLDSYGLHEVHGDQYAGEWVSSAFRRHAINYKPSELSRSEIYLETLPLFSQSKIELLDLPLLRTQLLLLERRTRAGGRDSVDHPRGSHDDLANSACGALWLASARRPMRISAEVMAMVNGGAGPPRPTGVRVPERAYSLADFDSDGVARRDAPSGVGATDLYTLYSRMTGRK
jgi:hypothetical protein